PVVAELGARQDLRVAVPGDGREAPPEEREPGARGGRSGDPEAPVRWPHGRIADDEGSTAVGRSPELEHAPTLRPKLLAERGAQHPVVKGRGEADFDGEGRSGDEQWRQQRDDRRGQGEWSAARDAEGLSASRRA